MEKIYGRFANRVSDFFGSVWSVMLLLASIALSGIFSGFSHSWESRLHLAMAFLALVAVFFLQRSERHDSKATNLKLDELIKALDSARNEVTEIKKDSDEAMDDA